MATPHGVAEPSSYSQTKRNANRGGRPVDSERLVRSQSLWSPAENSEHCCRAGRDHEHTLSNLVPPGDESATDPRRRGASQSQPRHVPGGDEEQSEAPADDSAPPRRHWSPPGRRRDAQEAKFQAARPASPPIATHLRETPARASTLMTPTKSIESKYARSSPTRQASDVEAAGRLAGHPGFPSSSRTRTGDLMTPPQGQPSAARRRRTRSAPRVRPSASEENSRRPRTARSPPTEKELAESPLVKALNGKITKLYNWHLVEMDLVQKQQQQLNQVSGQPLPLSVLASDTKSGWASGDNGTG